MAFRWHWDRPSRNGFSLLPLKLASHGKLVTNFTPSKALAEKKSQSYGHFPHPCPPSIKQALCFAFVAKVCFAHCSTSRLARGSPGWLVGWFLLRKFDLFNFYMVSSCSILFTDFGTLFVFAVGPLLPLSVIFFDFSGNFNGKMAKIIKMAKNHFSRSDLGS